MGAEHWDNPIATAGVLKGVCLFGDDLFGDDLFGDDLFGDEMISGSELTPPSGRAIRR